MQLMISSEGEYLESKPSLRFGRAPYFIKYNLEEGTWEALKNPATDQRGGAGVKAAQIIIDHNITHVLSGRFGPNAHQALSAAKLRLITFDGKYISVNEVIKAFKNNDLIEEE